MPPCAGAAVRCRADCRRSAPNSTASQTAISHQLFQPASRRPTMTTRNAWRESSVALAAPDRLPDEENAEMREQHRARKKRIDIPRERGVQRQQHSAKPPLRADSAPCSYYRITHRSGLIVNLDRLLALLVILAQFRYGANYSMGRRQIATLARFTLLEAWRTRLTWLFSFRTRTGFGAGISCINWRSRKVRACRSHFRRPRLRLVAVFVLSLYILTSLVREFNDKGLELTLSFALRRADYILAASWASCLLPWSWHCSPGCPK